MLKNKKDWNRKFLRLRQQADQHLGRAEKTEVLSEDLQLLEKRVEEIKQVCLQTHKKVSQCMQGQGADIEKRLKKMPASSLSYTMIELSSLLQADKLLGSMLKLAGDVEGDLARDQLESEVSVEKKVLDPLQTVIEHDIPGIMKTKKMLKSLTLDMDSNKNRLQALQKQGVTPAKLDAQKEEYEEAVHKVDQCKDLLATEMYTFVSKEADYSNLLLELIVAQTEYHKKALEKLEAILPQMQESLEQSVHMPVYKCLLEDHLRRSNRDIATVLEECICVLFQLGMEEEGLFRIAGSASRVKKLKAAFDSGFVDMEEYIQDIHCIAGALKLYFRELPEPLLTYDLYDEWVQSIQLPHDQKLQTMWSLLERLPKSHYNNLRYLVKFLAKLAEHQDVNKMSATNLAIVFGPNLIWPDSDQNTSILITSTQSAIAEILISHADWFFPGDLDFRKTGKGLSSPSHIRRRSSSLVIDNGVVANSKNNKNKRNSVVNAVSMAHNTLTAPVTQNNSPPGGQESGLQAKSASQPSLTQSTTPHKEITGSLGSLDSKIKNNGVSSSSSSSSLESRTKTPCDNIKPSSRLESCKEEGTGDENFFNPGSCRRSFSSLNSVDRPNHPRTSSLASLHMKVKRQWSEERELGKSKGPNGEAISDTTSEPGMFMRNSPKFDIPLLRATTPPPKPPPPKSMHSDVYNTVFALQALGNGDSATDYLNRVRNLWDGHMSTSTTSTPNKRYSFSGKDPEETSKSALGHTRSASLSGTPNIIPVANKPLSGLVTTSPTTSTTTYKTLSGGSTTKTEEVSSKDIAKENTKDSEIDFMAHAVPLMPYGANEDFEEPSAPVLTATSHAVNDSPTPSPSSSQSNLAVQHSPEGSLDGVASGGTSPKPRRKKMAPPPPLNKPERPVIPAPQPPDNKGGAGDGPPLQVVVSPPIEKPDKPSLPPSPKPPIQDKPPALDRPQFQAKPVVERKKSSSEEKTFDQVAEKSVNEGKPEKKPDRPSSPKFERPKKPEKPNTLPPPKPDAPPNLQRLSSIKPPRPEPPPPPIPTSQQTVNQDSGMTEAPPESPVEHNTYF